jgi:hypothetical protein
LTGFWQQLEHFSILADQIAGHWARIGRASDDKN